MRSAWVLPAVAVLFCIFSVCSFAQLPTGTPVFGSYDSDGVNTINLGNLNVHTQIPIVSRPGKGIPFSAILNHDNVAWYPSGGKWAYTTNGSTTGLDWIGSAAAVEGNPTSYTVTGTVCGNGTTQTIVFKNWTYPDVFNTAHGTPLQLDSAGCLYGTSGTGTSADGYTISANITSNATSAGPTHGSVSTQIPWGNPTYGNAIWQSLNNVFASDGASTYVTLTQSLHSVNYSDLLEVTGFNFAIPSAAVINGIQVDVQGYAKGTDIVYDGSVILLKSASGGGSTWVGNSLGRGIYSPWPSSETYWSYGSSNNLWGATWTPADINSPNFGIGIAAQSAGTYGTSYAYIDYIRITVYYTAYTGTSTVTSPSGLSISSGLVQDAHSNQISVSGSGTLNYYDTLSNSTSPATPVLTKTGSPAALSETYAYTGGGDASAALTVSYTKYTLQTAFGCPNIAEYSQANFPLATTVSLPALPNGTVPQYTITYEITPGYANNSFVTTGRIYSITLPTGGIILFSYTGSNYGINCNDGSTMGFTKQTPDGNWTYSRSMTSYGSQLTITSPAPDSNVTIINFDTAGHELQRQIYQGSTPLLETIVTCYNGTLIGSGTCPTRGPTGAISEITSYTQIPDYTGIQSEVDTNYNTIALPTEVDTYDWGASTPTTSVVMTYCTGLAANIQDRLCTKTTHAGTNSGTIVADQKFSYFSAGDLKSAADWVSGTGTGALWLTKNYTYDSYGVLQTAQDVNNVTTTYSSFTCNNAFPQSISSTAVTWTTAQTWDCNGGVRTSVKDGNNHTVNYGYGDPFWRTTSVGDTLSTTTTTYTSANQSETVLNIGTASTQDVLTTLDVLGRVNWVQKRQSPTATNFDSVGYFYDTNGRPNKITVPASCPSGGCTGLATWSKSYDALGRVLSVTDPSTTATTSYSYSKNDVLISSPSPTVQKQLEYNALGQLTSVCELTTTSLGSGNCTQANAAKGYLTTYSYSPLYLSTVTQNAQSATGTSPQTRTFGPYDGLGRMSSETNPETGTVNYSYDSLSSDTACGSPSFAGDLVKRVDNVQNATCYSYDGLHRMTTEGNSTVSTDILRYFVYDSATVNSVTMSNTSGRMAEAYTVAASSLTSKLTDEGFSYDIRGEITDAYQSTAHSGGYFHTTATYYVNGAPASVGGTSPMTALTYGLDGEGRVATISGASGQNPLTATNYDAAGHVTSITFGSGDSESFTFDPNTGRMTEYKSAIGATPKYAYGDLTWNPNGTLQQLAITDQTNTANSQTCSYTYDDLGRSTGISCGTLWSQTFSYDNGLGTAAFGNLSKSGNTSFQPTYNSKNQYQSLPSFTPTYDSNGNLLTDSFHTYSWDPTWGVLTKIDTTNVQYDALGRMVESSGSNQIVYSPLGSKIDYMNGQSTNKGGFVNVPGGAQVLFSTTGVVSSYRHTDWLGSKRFATGTGRSVTLDVAYAPYGEQYANSTGTNYNFTGMDNDTKSDLFDFPAREYHPTQGRWISPDPAGLRAVTLANPQSWNRYAYVMNSPLQLIDPTGLDCSNGTSGGPQNGGAVNCPGVSQTDLYSIAVGIAAMPQDPPKQEVPLDPTAILDLINYNGSNLGQRQVDARAVHQQLMMRMNKFRFRRKPISTPGTLEWVKNFVKAVPGSLISELQQGGCFNVWMNAAAEGGIVSAVSDNLDAGPGPSPDELINKAGFFLAVQYMVNQGLTVPWRSSVYRDIISGTETATSTFVLADTFTREGQGFYAEYEAYQNGECR